MKRAFLTCSVGLVLAVSCVRLDLNASPAELRPDATANDIAADEQSNATTSQSDSERDRAIQDFVGKLNSVSEYQKSLVERFRQEIGTQAGQVVMAGTIHEHENRLRQEAESESAAAIAVEHFEKSGTRYALKKDHSDFAARFEAACRQFEQDAFIVTDILQDYGNRLTNDSEVNQLVKRYFLDSEAAAQVYLNEVQDVIRPDYRVARKRWDEFLALDRNNRLAIRSGAKRSADQMLNRMAKAQQTANRLFRETNEWRRDLSESNPTSKAVREAMGDTMFAALFAIEGMNEDYPVEQRIENYFSYVEDMFVDKADGLVPADDRLAEVQQNLENFATIQALGKLHQPLLQTMAKQIADGLPNKEAWREVLLSDVAVVWTISQFGTTAADVEGALKGWLDQWIEEVADGKLSVRADHQEDKLNSAREWLRNSRAFRRKGLEIVEFGKLIDHPSLSADYQTTAGKCLVLRSLQDRLSRQYFDGMGAWIKENFDVSDDGYTIKEGHDHALTNILDNIDRVTQEMANDDF